MAFRFVSFFQLLGRINMKIGIIDVGGGFRDIYGAGVLDVCMEQGIRFDYCIGISAGSANLISYLSWQPKRSCLVSAPCSSRRRSIIIITAMRTQFAGSMKKAVQTMTVWWNKAFR